MRKKLLYNLVSSFALQAVTIICGFILPRQILMIYGSETNGLVNSISQFLHIISFLELGVGAVVQSALYKPLAQNDNEQIGKVIFSASRFFRKIATILFFYVLLLIATYPYISDQNFGFIYTGTLIAAISVSSFAQYYFGVVDGLLLNADQRSYVVSCAGIITVVLTTVVCYLEMLFGVSIHFVKLSSSFIYLLRPVIMRIYINRHYKIQRDIKVSEEPIRQKWNGIAQHVCTVVLDQTDVIILTVFSTLSNVSIYSVYQMVVYGIKNLFFAIANSGVQSILGELWAKKEIDKTSQMYRITEWTIHTVATYIYTCTSILIIPFVLVYTSGVADANYNQPLFAGLIVFANAMHCLRLPYHVMIKAAGRYKETQSNYIVTTIINIVISVVTVRKWGLVGVAVGTLIAMLYQTVWMAYYCSKKLVSNSYKCFIKQMIVNLVTATVCIVITSGIRLMSDTYWAWGIMALEVAVISLAIFILINLFVYKKNMKELYVMLKGE